MDDGEKQEILDYFTYGFNVEIVSKKGKMIAHKVYLHDHKRSTLVFHQQQTKNLQRVDISLFSNVYLGKDSGNFTKIETTSLNSDRCITIHISKSQTFDLIFENRHKASTFAKGLKILKAGITNLSSSVTEYLLK